MSAADSTLVGIQKITILINSAVYARIKEEAQRLECGVGIVIAAAMDSYDMDAR